MRGKLKGWTRVACKCGGGVAHERARAQYQRLSIVWANGTGGKGK